jgi:hypothetical protein
MQSAEEVLSFSITPQNSLNHFPVKGAKTGLRAVVKPSEKGAGLGAGWGRPEITTTFSLGLATPAEVAPKTVAAAVEPEATPPSKRIISSYETSSNTFKSDRTKLVIGFLPREVLGKQITTFVLLLVIYEYKAVSF